MSQNALLRKNGEFIVKDQIIFKYAKPISVQQVKEQVSFLLGKRARSIGVEVELIDKTKNVFLIAGKGAHLLTVESVAAGFVKGGPIPPPPHPIIPSDVLLNTLLIKQNGIKNSVLFRVNSFMK